MNLPKIGSSLGTQGIPTAGGRIMARLSFSGLIVLAALVGPLAGCGDEPARQTFADLRFTNEPPLRLGVASLDINDEYRPNFDPPHYEQRMPIPLPHIADNCARDRLQPACPTRP